MRRFNPFIACSIALLATTLEPGAVGAAVVTPHTFSTRSVPTGMPIGRMGFESGVDVRHASFVRISASGSISVINGPCGRLLEPQGCNSAALSDQLKLSPGVLAAIFVDANGQTVSSWQPVGTYAVLPIPLNANHMLLRIYDVGMHGTGAFTVVSDVLPEDASQRGSLSKEDAAPTATRRTQSIRSGDPGTGQAPVANANTRRAIQHLVRRFGFSASPEQITAIQNAGGPSVWMTAQMTPASVNDAAAQALISPEPVVASQAFVSGDARTFPTRLFQSQVYSQRQLLEKMTMHWIDHFAVSNTKTLVFDYEFNGTMEHYIQTLRKYALGNFTKLLTETAKEPAVQFYLDEAFADASDPTMPPNENFGREIMQLYSIGTTRLNSDGTPVLDGTGTPIPAYTEADVKKAALLLSGITIPADHNDGAFPNYSESSVYTPALHPAATTYTIMGQSIVDPGGTQCAWSKFTGSSGSCVYDTFISMLAHQPTTWAYESKEMIQRFASENPSPAFVARITKVWGDNVDASNQIALVAQAISKDPEFLAGRDNMVKEPIEFIIDAMRALHPTGGSAVPAGRYPNSLSLGVYQLYESDVNQDPWYPPSVFSFYVPGNKATMYNNGSLLKLWNFAGRLTAYGPYGDGLTTTKPLCSTCDTIEDMTLFSGSINGAAMAAYLLDALVDGGTPALNALVTNYLNNNANNLNGAVWIILTSPEYGVN